MIRLFGICFRVAVSAVALLALGHQAHATDVKPCQPEQVAKRYPGLAGKTVVVGQDAVSLPYSYHDPNNPDHILGADADYARAVFACIGVPVTFQIAAWSGLLPAVASGRIDVMWDDLYYTPQRAQRVDYVLYSLASDTAVLRKGNPKNITSLDDLCGVRAVAGLGTVEALLLINLNQKCTQAGKQPIQVITYQDRPSAWQMIETNRADIVLSSSAMAAAATAEHPAMTTGFNFLPDVKVGIATAKGRTELEQAIADAMAATLATGQIAKIYASYKLDPKLQLQPVILTK
ncbi:transporter substrate-binding domain-containing protein [Rhodopila sp.]|uniref:transporter substrate-binding domain-containing protein n=1 Tax=Rhodopila sp. TaxID=2480087 RepID=UPI003D121360